MAANLPTPTDVGLQNTLLHTYHPDPALRKHAEQTLEAYVTTGQALFTLLQVVSDPTTQAREVRQAAGIVVKNRIRALWVQPLPDEHGNTKPCLLQAQEKAQARGALVNVLLAESDTSVRGMVAEAFKTVADLDYPERWPELVPALVAQVTLLPFYRETERQHHGSSMRRSTTRFKPRTRCASLTR